MVTEENTPSPTSISAVPAPPETPLVPEGPSMMARAAENHPALKGRGPEAQRLADAVRRLIVLTVTNSASADDTAEIAGQLEAVADRLESHVPDEPFPRFFSPPEGSKPADIGREGWPPLGTHMPYDVIVGGYNPLAVPATLEFDPPIARARVRFTTPYEGAPGCVHGAALAATFDIVLTAANAVAEAAGPTVRLSLRYRRPTLLDEEAVFEGWVTELTDRRVHSVGRIVQAGVVTVEAEGEFAVFGATGVEKMARMRKAAVHDVLGGAGGEGAERS
jgi:hypothetical protein